MSKSGEPGQTVRAIAAMILAAMALTACGLKPGVTVAEGGARDGRAVTDPSGDGGQVLTDGAVEAETAGPVGGDSATVAAPPGLSGGSTQVGSQPGQPTAPTQQSTEGLRPVRGSDRTGVTDTTIFVASHAPITGAAPVPSTTFRAASDLYWRWRFDHLGEKVLGRNDIRLTITDDQYDPNSARQICRELASRAFLVNGAAGTDQIQACGVLAGVQRFPYFSAGVTEAGLRDNPWYFAGTMSYKQQGPLLARLIKSRPELANLRVAAIVTDTPNFDDAVEGWEAGVAREGLDYYKTLRHPKGDQSWYDSFVNELIANKVELVFPLTSPVDYINLAQRARQKGLEAKFAGIGVTMGINAVLGSGCPHVDGGLFFSPFPGMDWARQNVPEFFEAGRRFNVRLDDLAFGLWASNALLHQFLLRYEQTYGNDLTREDFRDMLENGRDLFGGVFPSVSFTPQDHFGSREVHLVRADCSKDEYVTEATFKSAF